MTPAHRPERTQHPGQRAWAQAVAPLDERAAESSLQGRLRSLGWLLIVTGLSLYLTVSALTLTNLGILYDMPGGSPLVKIHPGTHCLVLGLLLALAARGHPMAVLISRVRQMPLMACYLASMLLVAVWSVWRSGTSGAAFIVDTLWMPGVAVLALSLYGAHRHRQLLQWLMLLLCLNALLGLVEYALKTPMVERYPFYADLVPDEGLFRSSALLGHPLANALLTATLLPAALVLPLPLWLRWASVGLLSMSLLAFGSRTALIAAVVFYLPAVLLTGAWRTAHGRYNYLQISGGLLAGLMVLTAVVGTVLITGLGERIFLRLTWDNSANVRVVVWQALDHISDYEWWTGMPPLRIEDIAQRIGLDTRYETIENFWIVLVMQFGLIGFVPFMIGLGCGTWQVWRHTPWPLKLATPLYFLVASGANTLAAKSVSLTLLFVVQYCAVALVAAPQRPSHHRAMARGASAAAGRPGAIA